MKKLNRKGFTIIELVIVIAVIAILAAVMVPTFSSIVEKANKSAVEQEAASCFKELYALDWSDGKLDGNQGQKWDSSSSKYVDDTIVDVNDVKVYKSAQNNCSDDKYIEYILGTDGKTLSSFTFYNADKKLKVEYKGGKWEKATEWTPTQTEQE